MESDARGDARLGRRFEIAAPDGAMTGRRFGAPGAPPLLFAHANGLCASAYAPLFGALGDAFDVFAVDLRGHGRSRLPTPAGRLKDWSAHSEDIAAALDRLQAARPDAGPWTLAGHSLGAVSSLLMAARRPEPLALRLLDPVILGVPPRLARSALWAPIGRRLPIAKAAAARRSRWPSREETHESYALKPLFARWAPAALEGYLADGLVEDEAGVRLACAPAWEAANFAAQGNDALGAARRLMARPGAHLAILAAERGSTLGRAARRRLARLGASLEVAQDAGHLFPLERPEEAAAFLRGAPAAPA
ncbi:MAG: alpha/beta fold hydrolase [Pseudomonadota bacterium]